MNKLITTYNGGMPIVLDDVRWNDDAYRHAMNGILLAFGSDFIVQGCVYDGEDDSITAGYIMLASELIRVDAHTKLDAGYYQKVTTYNAAGLKTFRNASENDTYQQNRGLATAASGTLLYNGISLAQILVFWNTVGYSAGKVPKIGSVDLGASLPVGTDANKFLKTLSVADFRTLIAVLSSTETASAISAAITALGLGTAATKNVGLAAGNVLQSDGMAQNQVVFTSDEYNTLVSTTYDIACQIITGLKAPKIINFSGWNMDTTSSINIAHGISSGIIKIKSVKAKIIPNDGSYAIDLSYIRSDTGALGGGIIWDNTNVVLTRVTSGHFDQAAFNAATGTIEIHYIA